MRTPAIVVGTDGTDAGSAAVRWAAHEAERRNVPLRIIHVLDWDWAVSRYDVGGQSFQLARQSARIVAEDAIRTALDTAPGIELQAQIAVGRPAGQLLNAAVDASRMVVGNRGRSGITGLLLGSVSRRVAARAHCPVVVVRGRADPGTGPVAAGVDDAARAEDVLEAAFAAADRYDTDLVVVRSYGPDQETVERHRLTELLAPWRSKYPNVAVEMILSTDSTAATLTEISHGTRLVVAGCREHAMAAGALRGTTTSQLLHHADCPVLIVH
ncbi:nucleotide-binding universal stress UspA family protein [Actinoplanes octamycinicus]|uniref:Nucleotide-binding universal stress UspA family protein n=1 Tax=Actinoplanes octamycinicus TaxID=135948 RepID=A0A7W7H2S8_9ACTN|nr:universal stress protein [Actinoplanes octamycinicus]MBB4742929.1 nucleotide-binding universal stress UspA family protein [Actinoplanes octamycinicus]GIE58219.1 universal stress protein [Actinoplanes octamycinicus]